MSTELELLKRIKAVEEDVKEIHKWERGGETPQSKALAAAISTYLALPHLRAFWPMSAWGGAGSARDLAGVNLYLTNGNNALPYGEYAGDLVPHVTFTRTASRYLYRADEAAFDITGGEAWLAPSQVGLTMGGWFRFTTHVNVMGLMGKWQSPQQSYLLYWDPAWGWNATVYDGATQNTNGLIMSVADDTWYFLAMRWVPSTELVIWVNDTKDIANVGIVASLSNSTAEFAIGRHNSSNYFNGRASMCFLCGGKVSDTVIDNLFQRTRALFGV